MLKKHKYIILSAFAVALICVASIIWVFAENVAPAAKRELSESIFSEYDTTTQGIENKSSVQQNFTTSKSICGVTLKFNTENQSFSGKIDVFLYKNDVLVASGFYDMAQILNGVQTDIYFNEFIKAEKNANYTLKVQASYSENTGKTLSLWKDGGNKTGVIENDKNASGAIFLATLVNKTDVFLQGYFLIIAIILVIGTVLCFVIIYILKPKIHIIFFVAALVFGLCYNLVFPPNTTPDENVHINTSYNLANHMMGDHAIEEGTTINLNYFDYDIDASKFDAYSYKTVSDDLFKAFPTDATFISRLPIVSQISFFSYFPMAFGMVICKLFNANFVTMVFVARLFNLLSFAFITAFAIKIIPFGKKIFFAVGMLPMTISIAASVSYDAFVIAVSMLFISLCVKFAYSNDNMSHIKTAVLAALAAALAPCKMIYIFICGVCLIIPKAKFKTKKVYYASMAAILLCASISFIYVNFDFFKPYIKFVTTKTQYDTTQSAQPPNGAVSEVIVKNEISGELEKEIVVDYVAKVFYTPAYVLSHKRETVKLIINTFTDNTHYYLQQLVGGHLSEPILKSVKINDIFVALLYLCLILACLQTKKELQLLKPKQKIWILFVAACVCAALLAVVVNWTPAGSATIWGMQGRYLLPILPLIMLAVSNKGITIEKDNTQMLAFSMCALQFFVILNAFVVIIRV